MQVRIVFLLSLCLFGSSLFAATKNTRDTKLKNPETRRVDQVDEYFGVKVPDPYRWLEADVRESSEVAEWVKRQNEVAREYLDAIPQRAGIEKRLTELWNYERYSPPVQKGGRYFYMKNDGLQDQPVLYFADSYKTDGRQLVDPNSWSKDGTIAMSEFSPSEDGKLLAYARSEAGSDWQQIHIIDVKTGKALDETLKWSRFTQIDWAKDGSGFYYNRYPEPPAGELHQSAALNQVVSFHKLGTKQSVDKVVYKRPDHPDWNFGVTPSDDGKYLVLSVAHSTDPQNQVFIRDAKAPADAPFEELIGDFENQFSFIANEGKKLFFLTDLDAPTKRIVVMDLEHPGRRHVREVVAARKDTIDTTGIIGERILVRYMVDVLSEIDVFSLTGKSLGRLKLPGKGAVSAITGEQHDKEAFLIFTSYNVPAVVLRYDVEADRTEEVRQPDVKFKPSDYTVEQVFYGSKDGTRIPMMLAYRKNLTRTQPHPTLLYAYGGYSISMVPAFRPEYIGFMEMGGIVAVANLRGGGEYGEEWHLGGKNLKKQNVFDDFIAAAEWLVREGRTTREKLAIMGGSNGGLLVGAVEVQRPDLFGACIPMVGVMDMLRFHKFTAGPVLGGGVGETGKKKGVKK